MYSVKSSNWKGDSGHLRDMQEFYHQFQWQNALPHLKAVSQRLPSKHEEFYQQTTDVGSRNPHIPSPINKGGGGKEESERKKSREAYHIKKKM